MVKFEDLKNKKEKICVVGLGYVGLPLAVLLAKHFSVTGFDIKTSRIDDLKKGLDKTGEVPESDLKSALIEYTDDPQKIKEAKFLILAIPTPVDSANKPDLKLLEAATALVGKSLSAGTAVVYESTVYPGVTEDVCAPILEKESGLKCGKDFKVGYSPERVNPGDKEHTIDKIYKIVAGQDEESLDLIARVYGEITKIYRAASIKVAEAAKVIENTQRDINIALMNELAVIFHKMDIDTREVLAAAGTKWNFLKFYPGLVGGHCIGVDPYYLTHKAEELGYNPEVILTGRRINDSMGQWVAEEILKKATRSSEDPTNLKILIAGITFKENVPDIRNSKVYDIYQVLLAKGLKPLVCDPIADKEEVKREYDVDLCDCATASGMDAIIVAVAHDEFKNMKPADWKKVMSGKEPLLVDIKGLYDVKEVTALGLNYWRL